MRDGPQTWHHGLVAKWWSEFNLEGPDIAYFQRFIEQDGQPALDVGCGTGRLLLPYLRAGLDVDGCDVSADMIALCREAAARERLSPTLFVQAMHELDPPRRYRTIVVCGAFGLGSDREQDVGALQRFYGSLEPGGTLVLDIEVPYANSRQWRYWECENRAALPESWNSRPGTRKRSSDGNDYELRTRIVDLDPLRQSVTLQIRVEMSRAGRSLAEEEHTLDINLYFMNEFLAMLERAGFSEVAVRGNHTDEDATGDHDFLVFVARKPPASRTM